MDFHGVQGRPGLVPREIHLPPCNVAPWDESTGLCLALPCHAVCCPRGTDEEQAKSPGALSKKQRQWMSLPELS